MKFIIIFFIHANFSFAKEYIEPTWGLELTFTNKALISAEEKLSEIGSEVARKSLDIYKNIIEKYCKELPAEGKDKCSIKTYSGKYKEKSFQIIFKEFKFYVTLDPMVIEINADPLTLKDIKKYQSRIQKLFDLAKQVKDSATPELKPDVIVSEDGLIPHKRIGNGHLHLGKRAFMFVDSVGKIQEDTLLFRNFIVDYYNHPTLSMGIMGFLPNNAPAIAMLSKEQEEKFIKVINDFDQKKEKSLESFAIALSNEVYTKTYFNHIEDFAKFPQKYQALNVTRLLPFAYKEREKTIEIRGQRPQRSAFDLLAMVRVFEMRLVYLKRFKRPIDLIVKSFDHSGWRIKKPQRILDEYSDYLKPTRLPWQTYRTLLSEEFISEIQSDNILWDGETSLKRLSQLNEIKDIEVKKLFDPHLNYSMRDFMEVEEKSLKKSRVN